MSGYAVKVFTVCLTVGIASMMTYGGRERRSSLALSVLVLYAVALPLLTSGLPSVEDFFDGLPEYGGAETEGEYKEVASAALAEGIARAVCGEFSLSEDEVTVSVAGLEVSSMSAEEVTVILRGAGVRVDPARVKKFVSGIGSWRCRVEFEI